MRSTLALTLAALMATSAAAPAMAQPSYSDSDYQQRLRDWQAERDRYDAQRRAYEADRRAYDERYSYRRDYERYPTADPYRHYRDSPCERLGSSSDRRAAGTVIGALAGAALGASVAAPKVTGEGAILGAVVGGALGNSIAGADGDRYAARCDAHGYYYSYDETFPYREDASFRDRRSGRYDYDYYTNQRCRLAVAPYESDYRYVRVCPDRDGRYRLTD